MSNKIFVADKETLDAVKADTDALKGTAADILKIVSEERPKRYGYRMKIAEPDPASRVEYLFDAVGMTPAHMDFTAGGFFFFRIFSSCPPADKAPFANIQAILPF